LTTVKGAKASITSDRSCGPAGRSAALLIEVEVPVLDQQRHFERGPGETEFALTLLADDPEPGEPGIDVER
jgi:hypothetical protein